MIVRSSMKMIPHLPKKSRVSILSDKNMKFPAKLLYRIGSRSRLQKLHLLIMIPDLPKKSIPRKVVYRMFIVRSKLKIDDNKKRSVQSGESQSPIERDYAENTSWG